MNAEHVTAAAGCRLTNDELKQLDTAVEHVTGARRCGWLLVHAQHTHVDSDGVWQCDGLSRYVEAFETDFERGMYDEGSEP